MNCKPGDLAVVIGYAPSIPHLTGKIVEVMTLAPVGAWFKLPDGRAHRPSSPGCWVIRFLSPVDLTGIGGQANSAYAACHDSKLQPLRDPGDDAVDEMLQRVGSPNEVTV